MNGDELVLDRVSMSVYTDAVLVSERYNVAKAAVLEDNARWAFSTMVPAEAEDVMINAPQLKVLYTEVFEPRATIFNPMDADNNAHPLFKGRIVVPPMTASDGSSELGNAIEASLYQKRLLLWVDKERAESYAKPILMSLPTEKLGVSHGGSQKEVHIVVAPLVSSDGKKRGIIVQGQPQVMLSYRLPAVAWSFVHMLDFPRSKPGKEGEAVEGALATSIIADFRQLPLQEDEVVFERVAFINKALGSFQAKRKRASPQSYKGRGGGGGENTSYEAAAPRRGLKARRNSGAESMAAANDDDDGTRLQADAEGEWAFDNVRVSRFAELTIRVHSDPVLVTYVNTVQSRGYDKNPESCLLFGRDDKTLAVLSRAETGRLVVHMGQFLLTDSKVLRPDDKVIQLGPMTTLTIDMKHIADNLEKQWHEEQLDVYNKANEPLMFALLVRYASKVVVIGANDAVLKSYVPETNLVDPTERTIMVPVVAQPSNMTRLRYRYYD